MKFASKLLISTVILSLDGILPATAATVDITGTFDPSAPGVFDSSGNIYSYGTGAGFSDVTPKLVGVGDDLTIKYMFGGQEVTASSLSFGWVDIWDYDPATGDEADGGPDEGVNMTGAFSLLDALGNAIFTSDPQTSAAIFVDIAPSFNLSLAGPLAFYGVLFSGHVNSSLPVEVARIYNLPALTLKGTDISVAAVPLPAGLTLELGGLGVLGFLAWRKKRPAESVVLD